MLTLLIVLGLWQCDAESTPKSIEESTKLSFGDRWIAGVSYNPKQMYCARIDTSRQLILGENSVQNLKKSESNVKVIVLEGLGGIALSSLSWYLATQLMPEESWDDPAGVAIIGLTEITLGAPLSATMGTTLIGRKFDQNGSLWRCFLGSLIGSWTAFFTVKSSDKAGLGIVIGSSVGALIGYNWR